MRGLRIFVSAFLVMIAVTSIMPLAGCSNTPQTTQDSTQGMAGGRGPDYNH
jgi:hypothetical protein